MKRLSNYKPFLSVFALLIFSNLLHRILGYNELTLLAYAKSFYDPNWIPNDFALSTKSDYQVLYNYIAGFLASFLPLTVIAVIGRFIVYFFFSVALHYLNKILKLPWYLFAFAVFVFIGNQSVIAGEWMVKGFEFKTLAYSAIFMALYFWVRGKKYLGYLFLGLAVSFHVLIGCFSFISLAIAGLLSKEKINFSLIKGLPLFFIFGFIGWLSIFQFLFTGSGTDISAEIIQYYVQLRVAHHVYPPSWEPTNFIFLGIYVLTSLLCFLFVLKEKEVKFIYLFACSHLLFFGSGLFFFFIGDYAKLSYYWFRTTDVFMSLFFFISLAFFAQALLQKLKETRPTWANYFVKVNCVVFSILLLLLLKGFIGDALNIKNSERLNFVDNRFPYLNDMYYWINDNTAKEAAVISGPYDEFYYVMAERRAFVNFKTGPAAMDLQKEWYERMKLLNNNQEFDFNESFYSQWQTFENNFNQIDEDRWRKIGETYNFQYVLCKSWVAKDFEIAYQNEAFILYKIN